MSAIYICRFELFGAPEETIIDGGIADIADGFWIDGNLKFTKGGDNVYWIPPARVRHVVKKETNSNAK